MNNNDYFYCPIYKKEIDVALCMDINYERLQYFKTGALKDIKKLFNLEKTEVDEICNTCEYTKLDKE